MLVEDEYIREMKLSVLGKDVPAILFAGMLMIAGAGAAAGVAASGTVTGESSTQVEQAIVLEDIDSPVAIAGADDSVVQVSDDRTTFVAGATIKQGESYDIAVNIRNNADTELPARLVVDADEPLHVHAEGTGDVEVQRVSETTFILNAPAGTADADDIVLTVEAANDAKPGFSEVEATIQPVEVQN